jgi:hypothetical protein
MPSKSRLVSKAFSTSGVLSTIASENPTVDTGTTQIANVDALPTSGNETGDQLFIEATNRLYIWNGSGWYNIALINTSPTWDSGGQPAASYELDVDSPQDATIISLAASDAEGLPIQYSYVTSGSMDSMATISQDSSVFTITPKTVAQVGEGVELTGSITFRASDGVNILPSISSFVLNFVFTVENSKYTTLLLEAVDTSDNNNIIDSSSNNHAITVTGDARASSYSPYRHGGYSTYFDGTGDKLSVSNNSNFDVGSNDFTLEFWYYPQTSVLNGFIAGYYSSTNNQRSYAIRHDDVTGNLSMVFSTDGTFQSGNATSSNITPTDMNNKWNHIAITKSGTTAKLWHNGNLVATNSSAPTTLYSPTSGPFNIGTFNDSTYIQGYLTDVRLVVGTELYTSNFTPPSTRLTAITNTSLLTCHLPYFADGSTNNHAITVSGNPVTSPFGPYDNKKYSASSHGGSVYFDGSGDYLTISNDTSLNLANTSFTIECWVFPMLDYSNYRTIFCKRVSGSLTTSYQGYLATSTGRIGFYNGTVYESSTVLVSNAWSHCAWVYDGTNIKIFVNGTQVLSQTTSISEIDEPLSIGFTRGYTEIFGGYISDFRIVKGTAVYTGNFTPPTFPLTAVTNTSLLLSGTDASIIDKSQTSNLKLVGNTTGSTTQVKFTDTKSIYFASVSQTDYASSKHGGLLSLSGPFTIEFWCNMNTGGAVNYTAFFYWTGTNYVARLTDSGFGNRLQLCFDAGAQTGIYAVNATRTYLAGLGWFHFAWTRDNNNDNRIFINGSIVNVTGGSNWSSYPSPSSFPLSSFNDNRTLGSSADFVFAAGDGGYVQDFRVTKGLARYTANFTPPTEPLLG